MKQLVGPSPGAVILAISLCPPATGLLAKAEGKSHSVELEEVGKGESAKGIYGLSQSLTHSAHSPSSPTAVEVLKTVSAIIDAGSSINLYMFHGGTNFGFINGAMHFHEYKADVTSYGKYSPILPLPGTPQHFCV